MGKQADAVAGSTAERRLRSRAFRALVAALREATEDGLRDLHEILQTGVFEGPAGRAILVRGTWGDVGVDLERRGLRRSCPLGALFVGEARTQRGVEVIAAQRMGKHGFQPGDFYAAWDRGLLRPAELRDLVEERLGERLDARLRSRSS